ncbi:MAG TPA: class IV adenylate cyclase [Lacipirellulaceae bacterium]|nr:class IV adenylate cyclase [Lacipirellulaceae bacterium]
MIEFVVFVVSSWFLMKYEVEQKHLVNDTRGLVAELERRGVVLRPPMPQSDEYFTHPACDFAKTDEALRIRTTDEGAFVTYKGPKLDTMTKTRRELELPLHAEDTDGTKFAELLAALGFRTVATVRKQRRQFHIDFKGHRVEGALDDVERVGTFVELELAASDENLDIAKQIVRELAEELRLGPSERRSYLELLLEKTTNGAN